MTLPRHQEKGDPVGQGPGDTPVLSGPVRRLALFTIFFMVLLLLFATAFREVGEPISYTDFKTQLMADNVVAVKVKGQTIHGTYRDPARGPAGAAREPAESFVTLRPSLEDPRLMGLFEQHGVEVLAEKETNRWLSPLTIGLLPLLLLVFFFLFIGRLMKHQLGDVGDRLYGFGRSRAVRHEKGRSDVTFEDVAGLNNAKLELGEIIEYLKDPERFRKLGAKIPRGVLLLGPPGTGKTLLARAVAGEADVPFFSISGSEFIELFVGVGASRVRDMFESARKEAPAILFIDEIDSVGRARGAGLGGGHDEREQTLNQILAAMDGFSPHEAVIVLAATNRPDVLDPALLRPGRFDRKITLDLPSRKARHDIMKIHTREVPLSSDVDLEDLAARTVGFSGADLENLSNEAALQAARGHKEVVEREDFEQARDRVLLGGLRDDLIIETEKESIAYHEAGHALVARLLPGTDPLQRVTIIPRGRALGATEQLPEEERHNLRRSYLLARIGVLLGGRAAEMVVFGEVSTGAEDDLKKATQLARQMVCQWGMSEALGPVALRLGEEHVFLGREMAQLKDFSEHTGQMVDREIRRLVGEMEGKATEILQRNRRELDILASALLERETLDAEDVDALLIRNRVSLFV